MENEKKLTLWSRAAIAAVWLRDSFASWFTTAWLYLILWGVVGLAFAVLLYIDATFSRGLAPESINPLSFQGMGIAYRLFAASFLMAAARCKFKGIKGGHTFRWLGVFASVIVCMHAFGFGFEALDDRRDQAMKAQQVQQVAVSSNEDVIARLEAQKVTIRDDLSEAVAPLDAEITQYITDGRNNDDLADASRARRAQLQDEARAKASEIDDRILELTVSGADTRTQALEATVDAEPWAPLFVGMAQLLTWEKEPDDWSIYLSAIGFVVFWVLLGESLVIFLPERIYVMHLNDAEIARAAKDAEVDEARSAASKKGWETRKARDRGPKKVVQAGTKSDVNRKEYWQEAVAQMIAHRENKMPKAALSYLVEKFGAGRTEAEFRSQVRDAVKREWVTQADHDKLLQIPAISNGAADPEDTDFTPPNTGADDADNNAGDQLN